MTGREQEQADVKAKVAAAKEQGDRVDAAKQQQQQDAGKRAC